MKAIFENPCLLEGEKENVVLLYKGYVIAEITRETAQNCIESLDKGTFNGDNFEMAIAVDSVFEYEFEPGLDEHILFSIKNANGKTRYENVDFKDADEAIKAENVMKGFFEQLGLKREEKQLTAGQAALKPGGVAMGIALIGGFITWLSYMLQDYQPTRTRMVKMHVYIFYKISQTVGYLPFLAITMVLIGACMLWMVKRMKKPPLKIYAVK